MISAKISKCDEHEQLKIYQESGEYGGGDERLQNQIVRDPNMADTLEQHPSRGGLTGRSIN